MSGERLGGGKSVKMSVKRQGNFPTWQENQSRNKILTGQNSRSNRLWGQKVSNGRTKEHLRKVDEKSISFLFKNFPEDCSLETLKECFSKVGRISDIFLPKKRDRYGKVFGFVRFPRIYNEEDLLTKLNEVWIGSYKIRVSTPRFNRNEQHKLSVNPRKSIQVQGGYRRRDVSYADAFKGKINVMAIDGDNPTQEEKSKDCEVRIEFCTKEHERRWLESCYTGYIKSELS